MYYDNKRTFYVKQYGPTVIVSVIAIALISTGVLFYFNSNSKNPNDAIASKPDEDLVDVATNIEDNVNEVQEPEKVEPEPQPDVQAPAPSTEEETSALKETEVVPYFSNLEKLIISNEVDVTSVDNNGNVSLEYNGDKLTVAMIGINYTYATDATYNKIKSDLEGKKVKIAFDSEREVNGTSYAYIYLNDKLYNATLLESGLATLKSERVNVALATDLSKAQADARSNKLGVWNR